MAFLIYGTSEIAIGVDEIMIECPSCEAHNFADIMISSRYLHIFFVPFVPRNKETIIICKKCGLKRKGLDFKSRTLQNFKDLNSKFRHPYITYVGVGLVVITIIGTIITSLIR